ncbi:hypothetical protein AWRI1631_10970030 [Saccharomyces cerevisiae AWRI1631]|uniref:Uncharacterized protein n=1 Tax=Saccharomyces cerevisiae (strain AWRI1631) TaxID=545124 RepID=B5VTY4_YEAS6|nr:hypothetical protein AWRI1631_10970030 [Saccharomyces cerevisiae AWRI1631]
MRRGQRLKYAAELLGQSKWHLPRANRSRPVKPICGSVHRHRVPKAASNFLADNLVLLCNGRRHEMSPQGCESLTEGSNLMALAHWLVRGIFQQHVRKRGPLHHGHFLHVDEHHTLENRTTDLHRIGIGKPALQFLLVQVQRGIEVDVFCLFLHAQCRLAGLLLRQSSHYCRHVYLSYYPPPPPRRLIVNGHRT